MCDRRLRKMRSILGAVEAGGTKILAAVGRVGETPIRSARIATEDPEATLGEVAAFFLRCAADGLPIRALGVGSFGPLELDPASPRWGRITSTPKLLWRDTDVAGTLGRALGVPVGFDTDVNAAALAEARLGAGRGRDPVVYLTVGTGIGGGAYVNGRLLHGAQHPEMGHMLLARHEKDAFSGTCPFHGSCWEGLASGTAILARWARGGEDLQPDHPAWELEAWYLAQGIVSLLMAFSPKVVILGGGVMKTPGLLDRVRRQARELCAGYLERYGDSAGWEDLIRAPELENPGLAGAFLLAEDARMPSRASPDSLP